MNLLTTLWHDQNRFSLDSRWVAGHILTFKSLESTLGYFIRNARLKCLGYPGVTWGTQWALPGYAGYPAGYPGRSWGTQGYPAGAPRVPWGNPGAPRGTPGSPGVPYYNFESSWGPLPQ